MTASGVKSAICSVKICIMKGEMYQNRSTFLAFPNTPVLTCTPKNISLAVLEPNWILYLHPEMMLLQRMSTKISARSRWYLFLTTEEYFYHEAMSLKHFENKK